MRRTRSLSALVGETHKELVSSSWWDAQGACYLVSKDRNGYQGFFFFCAHYSRLLQFLVCLKQDVTNCGKWSLKLLRNLENETLKKHNEGWCSGKNFFSFLLQTWMWSGPTSHPYYCDSSPLTSSNWLPFVVIRLSYSGMNPEVLFRISAEATWLLRVLDLQNTDRAQVKCLAPNHDTHL